MMVQAESRGAPAVPLPTPIPVALVISLPILATQVQEVLSRRSDIEVRCTARGAAEFAAFAGRDWLEAVICELADANEIRSLLHPGQRLVVLGPDGLRSDFPRDLLLDGAGSRRSTHLADFAGPPAARPARAEERRLGKPDGGRRRLVEGLLRQHADEVRKAHRANDQPAATADEWILTSLPRLGRATALLFLSTQKIPESKRDANRILQRLRAALRTEDAVLRLDDATFVVLMGVPTPASIPSLLIRLSWRLWPADPTAIAASHAVWQPGQDIEGVIAAGRLALFTALGASQTFDTVTEKPTLPRAESAPTRIDGSLLPAWEAPHPDLRRRGLEVEPWCADLPGFADGVALHLAVEAQEEEEFGHVGHGLGVARIAEGLAAAMGLQADGIEQLRTAALLHDSGKLALDRALWGGRCTILPWQRKLMEAHTSFGSELAEQVGTSSAAVLAILHHHERWDGTGYPAKLQGDLIPLPARILFVAEVVDSMLRASYRRQPLTPSQAVGVLEAGAGHIWDPEVTRHAVRMVRGSR